MTDVEKRRDRVEATIERWKRWLPARKAASQDELGAVESLLNELLTALEAAEDRLQDVDKRDKDALGVWQVELVNGQVHNFVASWAMANGAGFFAINSSTLLQFVIDRPSGRSPVVLAVRADQVISYRRLADWDGNPDSPAQYSATPFAGPARPKAGDKVNVVVGDYPLIPHV